MSPQKVIEHALFLASGDSLTVRRLGEFTAWDEKLLKKSAEAADDRVKDLRAYDLGTPAEVHQMQGIHKALVMAAARAGDFARSGPRRPSTYAPASKSERVSVMLSIQFTTDDMELVKLADGRFPVMTKTWEFKWMPSEKDLVTLFGVGDNPLKVLVMKTVDEPPQVLAVAPDFTWAEFLARGFEFRL